MKDLVYRALLSQALLELIQEVRKLTEIVIEIDQRLTALEQKDDPSAGWEPPPEC